MPQDTFRWTDPQDQSVYQIPIPEDPRVNVQEFVNSYIKAQRATKASQAKKFPSSPTGQPRDVQQAMNEDVMRTPSEVAMDQMVNVRQGIPQAVTGIPGMVGSVAKLAALGLTGKAKDVVQGATEMGNGMIQPAVPVAKAMLSPAIAPTPESPEWQQAAQGAGAQLGAGLLGAGVELGGPPLAKALIKPERLEAKAAENAAKALRPSSLESKAVVQRIAPELAKRGMTGVRESNIDAGIMKELDTASQRLDVVRKRLLAEPRPEYQVPMKPLIADIDSKLTKLRKFNATSDAVKALEEVRADFAKLPDYATYAQVDELMQVLDDSVHDAGGFKQTSSTADRVKMKVQRGAGDLLRGAINNLDPELKIANHDYSLYRNAADVVERRQLGKVGESDSGLPGRGSILDDIIAGWIGNALAGPAGTAGVEAMNLARQTRGYANIKGNAQQRLAEILKPKPGPVGGNPRRLIGPGPPRLTTPDTSFVRATRGEYPPKQRK